MKKGFEQNTSLCSRIPKRIIYGVKLRGQIISENPKEKHITKKESNYKIAGVLTNFSNNFRNWTPSLPHERRLDRQLVWHSNFFWKKFIKIQDKNKINHNKWSFFRWSWKWVQISMFKFGLNLLKRKFNIGGLKDDRSTSIKVWKPENV